MDTGSILTTFFIVFRETLEAGLIVGIILTLLAHMKQRRYFPHVLGSSLAAVLVSVLAGFALMSLTESAQGRMQELLEGGISFAACAVLTYMIFWMDRQARKIKSEIETQIEVAMSRGEYFVLMSLPFLAIFREGAETVLFLSAVASKDSQAVSWAGGSLGFLFASLITLIIFVGGKKIPLRPLFQTTGVFLLFVAAGLLAHGIHEFEEVGVIPIIYGQVWDINPILNEKIGLGVFLKSLFGYNGNPSFLEVLTYIFYLFGIYWFLSKRRQIKPSVN